MDILLNQDNYMPSVAASGAGGRVTMVRPGVRANPVEGGYLFAPHTETDITMHMEEVTRQAFPYESDCWDSWNQTDYVPIVTNGARGENSYNVTVYSSTVSSPVSFTF
jgi:hypothetical protein